MGSGCSRAVSMPFAPASWSSAATRCILECSIPRSAGMVIAIEAMSGFLPFGSMTVIDPPDRRTRSASETTARRSGT